MAKGKVDESNKAKSTKNTKQDTKKRRQTAKKSDAAAKKEAKVAAGDAKKVSNAAAAKNKRIAKWEEEEYLILLEGWARDGLSMEQIAYNMGISKKTLYNWQLSSLPILHAIKKGKEVSDYMMENALFANGLAGNVIAQIFWLKNRKPDKWKDKVEVNEEIEQDAGGVVMLAPVLEPNNEPEDSMAATT